MIDLSLISANDKILCGLSGGADSICLAYMLKTLEKSCDIKVFACHLNHLTRGEESLRDLNFSKDFCQKYDIPFYSESIDISALGDKSIGFEASARAIRYEFFERALEHFGANKIATAHNADDNLETILLNISRGTGLRGLLGIPQIRGNIIRPILQMSRAEIEKYLTEHRISYIVDSSNNSDDYSRNKIRHHCLPILQGINEATIDNVTKMCETLKNDYDFIENFSIIAYNKIVIKKNDEFVIMVDSILAEHQSISFRILEKVLKSFDLTLTYDKFAKIINLCNAKNPSAKLDIYSGFEIKRRYQELIFSKQTKLDNRFELSVNQNNITITTNNFDRIYFEYPLDFNKVDIETLDVRTRKTGDIFKCKNHNKSLKKLFIERKIPKELRDFIPILCDKNGIIAVLYLGVSFDRLKINDKKIIFRSIDNEK